ncbi:hypothetical protein D3C81_2041710 [compost metagenome]
MLGTLIQDEQSGGMLAIAQALQLFLASGEAVFHSEWTRSQRSANHGWHTKRWRS